MLDYLFPPADGDSLTVRLERDLPEDQVRVIVETIGLLPGVEYVQAQNPAMGQTPNILFVWMNSHQRRQLPEETPPAP